MKESTPIEIILVHGTFASDASWIDPTSSLALTLSEKLDTDKITSFRWTGHNSLNERRKAGANLAKLVFQIHQDNPSSKIVIISHSHGGNVVLYAFRQYPKAQKLIFKCVFLGTPFIHYETRKILTAVINTSGALILITSIILTIILPMMIAGAFTTKKSDSVFLQIIASLIGLGVGGLGWIYLLNTEDSFIRWIIKKQKNIVTSMKTCHLRVPSLICITHGDEAGAWLMTNNKISKITFFIARLLQTVVHEGTFTVKMMMYGLLVATICIFIGTPGVLRDKLFDASLMPLVAYISIALTYYLTLFSCLVLPHFIRSHPGAFGYEGLLTFALINIKVSTKPQKFHSERTITHKFEFKRRKWNTILHSSFYEDQSCISLITSWILAESNTTTSSQSPSESSKKTFTTEKEDDYFYEKSNTPRTSLIVRTFMVLIYAFFSLTSILSYYDLLPPEVTHWLELLGAL